MRSSAPSWSSVQTPVNVDSRSAAGARPLARKPPSTDGIGARKSATPGGKVGQPIEQLEYADRRRGRVGAAAAHRGQLHEAAVFSMTRLHEADDFIRARQWPGQHLTAQSDQEGVIGAARSTADRFGVTAVGGAEGRQRIGDALGPVGRAIGQDIGTAGRLDQQTRIEQGKQIDHAGMLIQAMAQKARGAVSHLGGQCIQYGQAAQGKRGVIEVGIAFAAGEAAVGILGRRQVGDVRSGDIRGKRAMPSARRSVNYCRYMMKTLAPQVAQTFLSVRL